MNKFGGLNDFNIFSWLSVGGKSGQKRKLEKIFADSVRFTCRSTNDILRKNLREWKDFCFDYAFCGSILLHHIRDAEFSCKLRDGKFTMEADVAREFLIFSRKFLPELRNKAEKSLDELDAARKRGASEAELAEYKKIVKETHDDLKDLLRLLRELQPGGGYPDDKLAVVNDLLRLLRLLQREEN